MANVRAGWIQHEGGHNSVTTNIKVRTGPRCWPQAVAWISLATAQSPSASTDLDLGPQIWVGRMHTGPSW